MSVAINGQRPDVFAAFLDPLSAGRLQLANRRFSYWSLKTYLMHRSSEWPDIDSTYITELRTSGDYARLTLASEGAASPRHGDRIQYTFLLFRRYKGWKLSAISNLEKETTDLYGFRLTYHETELPAAFQFPRLF